MTALEDAYANAAKWRKEAKRMRDGLVRCAAAAGEDVSDGPPSWPDIVEWAVAAVRESRIDDDA